MDLLHAYCGGEVQIIIDGEENDSKRFLIVKVVCQKCGESEEVLRFGFEEVFEEVNP
jgi:hypothetical protein